MPDLTESLPLIVFTYSEHFHITKLAIKQAKEHLSPSEIIVLYDDLQDHRWARLGDELRNDLLVEYGIVVSCIPQSAVEITQTQNNGWIRQQYVKLNLHKILPHQSWIVLDGDSIILNKIDPSRYCYIVPAAGYPEADRFFCNYALDLDHQTIQFEGISISFNLGPIKHITRKTLIGIEKRIAELHGTSIDKVFDSFTLKKNRSRYVEFSEFDLIGFYENIISNESLPLSRIRIKVAHREEFISRFNQNDLELLVFAANEGRDDLPRRWYEDQGIKINENIWKSLNRDD